MSKKRYYANLYLTDRAYGGPEEGGWWYACGVPADKNGNPSKRPVSYDLGKHSDMLTLYGYGFAPQVVHDRRDRIRASLERRGLSFETDANGRGIESIICDGVLTLLVENHPPRAYPESRPHYE